MGDVTVITFIIVLKEIITPLMKLSLALQKKESSLADSVHRVVSVSHALKKMKLELNEEAGDIATRKVYQDHSLKGRTSVSYRTSLIDQLLVALEKRFPSSNILIASTISSFKNWPSPEDKDGIIEYGDHEIHLIKSTLSQTLTRAGVDLSEIGTEWSVLKSFIYQRYEAKITHKSLQWSEVFHALDEDLSNINGVIELLLTFPPTSVNNETTFSQTKLTKGKRRGHLKTDTLSDLIQIELETPKICNFDPKPAIDDWMITPSGRKRRVCYTSRTATNKGSTDEDNLTQQAVQLDNGSPSTPEQQLSYSGASSGTQHHSDQPNTTSEPQPSDSEASTSSTQNQPNTKPVTTVCVRVIQLEDISSDEEDGSDDDDEDNEFTEDELFLVKMKAFMKDYEDN